MAKAKQEEIKILVERNYVIPLRREWLKVPQYKRGKKAIKAVREFLARHMKVENRDVSKIALDKGINEAIWSRGIKRPPQKISVRVVKFSDGSVKAEFLGLPPKFKAEEEKLKKKLEKARKKETEREKKKKEKPKPEVKPEEKEKTEEEKLSEEEKKEKEKMLHKTIEVEQPRIMKTQQHKESKDIRRKALEK